MEGNRNQAIRKFRAKLEGCVLRSGMDFLRHHGIISVISAGIKKCQTMPNPLRHGAKVSEWMFSLLASVGETFAQEAEHGGTGCRRIQQFFCQGKRMKIC
jgi:hypothetical protein